MFDLGHWTVITLRYAQTSFLSVRYFTHSQHDEIEELLLTGLSFPRIFSLMTLFLSSSLFFSKYAFSSAAFLDFSANSRSFFRAKIRRRLASSSSSFCFCSDGMQDEGSVQPCPVRIRPDRVRPRRHAVGQGGSTRLTLIFAAFS